MQPLQNPEQRLLEKIRSLLPSEILQVEDFIDSLKQKNADRSLTWSASKLSKGCFRKSLG